MSQPHTKYKVTHKSSVEVMAQSEEEARESAANLMNLSPKIHQLQLEKSAKREFLIHVTTEDQAATTHDLELALEKLLGEEATFNTIEL